MKQIALLFLLLVAVIFSAYWLMQPENSDKLKTSLNLNLGLAPEQSPNIVKIGTNVIKVEVAKTEEARQIGLSNHTSLDNDTGMLFVFDQKNVTPPFWMKGMNFPIDIIWINDSGEGGTLKVVQINAEVPVAKSGISDNEVPRYSPSKPIDYVLEISSGQTKVKNIKVGDIVELPTL